MLRPRTRYPSQTIVVSGEYDQGAAKNSIVLGDGIGFPLEKDWVNNLFGFFEALLHAADVVADGTPDKKNNSQALLAIQVLIANAINALSSAVDARLDSAEARLTAAEDRLDALEAFQNVLKTYAYYDLALGIKNTGDRFDLTEVMDSSPGTNFSVSSGRVTVPASGNYELLVVGSFVGITTDRGISLNVEATKVAESGATHTVLFGDHESFSLGAIVSITNPSSQRVNVTSLVDGQQSGNGAKLLIRRLS